MEDKLYLKDGTLWDDDKSDEHADKFIKELGEGLKTGKTIVEHNSKYAYKENEKKQYISIYKLPVELKDILLESYISNKQNQRSNDYETV
jgi:hypothetical protein